MSSNLALNKSATASSYVSPFVAQRAVDGSMVPIQRWVCAVIPCWMQVDLGSTYWIDRWVVKHMGAAGWAPNYNMLDFKLQKSLDNSTWIDVDGVTGNTNNNTDRMVAPFKAKFLRVSVTKGLNTNNGTASIVEFQAYEIPPSSQYLSGLALSSGTLSPVFNKNTYSYTVNVGYDSTSITVTPTGEDSYSTITVNGTIVQSGQASQPINLNIGENTITVHVAAGAGGAVQDYSVKATRASDPYLTSLQVKNGMQTVPLNPAFSQTSLGNYNGSVANAVSRVNVILQADDPAAAIMVTANGSIVTKSGTVYPVDLNVGDNIIKVTVTSSIGSDSKTYTVIINKANQ